MTFVGTVNQVLKFQDEIPQKLNPDVLNRIVIFASSLIFTFQFLQAACKNAPDSADAKRAVELLYDTALISSGFTVSIKETLVTCLI